MKALNIELPKKVKADYQAVATVASAKNQLATLQPTNGAAVAGVAAVATENGKDETKNTVEKNFIAPVDNPLLVKVYTPNGMELTVLARNAEHKAFLLKMNPKPNRQLITLIKQG